MKTSKLKCTIRVTPAEYQKAPQIFKFKCPQFLSWINVVLRPNCSIDNKMNGNIYREYLVKGASFCGNLDVVC